MRSHGMLRLLAVTGFLGSYVAWFLDVYSDNPDVLSVALMALLLWFVTVVVFGLLWLAVAWVLEGFAKDREQST